MRKLFLMLAIFAMTVVPAIAGPSNAYTDITYDGEWFKVSGVTISGTNVTPTLKVRVTGADSTLESDLANWNGQYDMNGWQVPVYTVTAGETFKVDVVWGNAPSKLFGNKFSKDLIIWDGDASSSGDVYNLNNNAILNRDYGTYSTNGSGSWTGSLGEDEYYSCLFQVNKTSDSPLWRKIALPFIIQAASEEVVVVPAPAAVILAGFGTTLIGLVRRRTL